MAVGRILDIVFFLYFFTHIPITIFIDAQSVLPIEYFPSMARQMLVDYCSQMKDPMMMDPPVWFQSFCVCELFLQLPFFFLAAWAFFRGYKNNFWIRIPSIVYAAHVATTLVPILSYVYLNDFSNGKFPGPSTQQERLTLMAIYSPYLIIPLLMLMRFLFGGEHLQKSKRKAA